MPWAFLRRTTPFFKKKTFRNLEVVDEISNPLTWFAFGIRRQQLVESKDGQNNQLGADALAQMPDEVEPPVRRKIPLIKVKNSSHTQCAEKQQNPDSFYAD